MGVWAEHGEENGAAHHSNGGRDNTLLLSGSPSSPRPAHAIVIDWRACGASGEATFRCRRIVAIHLIAATPTPRPMES
jgi:hypothetical protein